MIWKKTKTSLKIKEKNTIKKKQSHKSLHKDISLKKLQEYGQNRSKNLTKEEK